jgi:hypothetical protein
MLTSKIRRTLALALAVTLAVILAACGGSSAISDGRYEPADENAASFTYLDFKGGKVEVGTGVGGTTISSATVKYSLKDGQLSFELGGAAVYLSCEVNGNTLMIEGVAYVKGGARRITRLERRAKRERRDAEPRPDERPRTERYRRKRAAFQNNHHFFIKEVDKPITGVVK